MRRSTSFVYVEVLLLLFAGLWVTSERVKKQTGHVSYWHDTKTGNVEIDKIEPPKIKQLDKSGVVHEIHWHEVVKYVDEHPKDLVLACFVSDNYPSQALQDEYEMSARRLKPYIEKHSITVLRVDVTGHASRAKIQAVMDTIGVPSAPYIKMFLGGIHPTAKHHTSNLPTVKKVMHPLIPTSGLAYVKLYNNDSIVSWAEELIHEHDKHVQEQQEQLTATVKVLQERNFDHVVEHSHGALLVAFHAPWCSRCKRMMPEWQSAAKLLQGHATLATVDCTVETKLAKRFNVTQYPTVKMFGELHHYDHEEMLDETVGDHMEWNYKGPLFDADQINDYVLRVIKQHEGDRPASSDETVVAD